MTTDTPRDVTPVLAIIFLLIGGLTAFTGPWLDALAYAALGVGLWLSRTANLTANPPARTSVQWLGLGLAGVALVALLARIVLDVVN